MIITFINEKALHKEKYANALIYQPTVRNLSFLKIIIFVKFSFEEIVD